MDMDPYMKRRARELRRNHSPTEKLLWKHLRGRRFAGFKFRRQHVLGTWVVDYCCYEAALILELDGESHLGEEESDQNRQRSLEAYGWKMLRFWNTEVFDDLEAVLQAIYDECVQRKEAGLKGKTPP